MIPGFCVRSVNVLFASADFCVSPFELAHTWQHQSIALHCATTSNAGDNRQRREVRSLDRDHLKVQGLCSQTPISSRTIDGASVKLVICVDEREKTADRAT